MYDSSFICTYNFFDVSIAKWNPISKDIYKEKGDLHDETETEEELLQMGEIIYKNELLAVFGLVKFDEYQINLQIKELYEFIFVRGEYNVDKDCLEGLQNIMKKLASELLSDDLFMGFILLFSYNYFHLIHLCLCDIFNSGNIKNVNIHALKSCFKM